MKDSIDLKLTGIAHGGEAFGKYENKIIFVAYALPGERVRVQVTSDHKRWARARLLQVLEPSPHRQMPACPYFGPDGCGGCQWQHIQHEAQLDYKARILRDQLQRLGGLKNPSVHHTRSGSEAWAYRTRMVFYSSGQGSLGLRKANAREIMPLASCPILHPRLETLHQDFNAEWDGLRSVDLSVSLDTGEKMVVLRTRRDEAPVIEVDFPVSIVLKTRNGDLLPLMGDPFYFETIAGHTYRFSPDARRPDNIPAAEALIDVVRAYLKPSPGQVLMDVYSGHGLLTLGLAGHVSMVIGIEENAYAMDDCAFSCSHLDNVILHEGPPARVLRKLQDPINLAVVTPPDEGLGHRIAPNLARLGARRLVYVAHNPATLARDIAQLQSANYRFVEATAIDTAPQTHTFTTVALFTR